MSVYEITRKGNYIKTWSGKKFWPLDPKVVDVDINDIAHALSHLCRYGGHVYKFYSVAEHSVIMAEALQKEGYNNNTVKWALLHDGTEAYCADVPRPIKSHLLNYAEIENGISKVIADKFDLSPTMPEIVTEYDDRIIINEMNVLMNNVYFPNKDGKELPSIQIQNWNPTEAKNSFLNLFRKLYYF